MIIANEGDFFIKQMQLFGSNQVPRVNAGEKFDLYQPNGY
jgi:hypothetical protein